MAKSLGQIHTVSQTFDNVGYSLAPGNQLLIDLPGELTRQLQHMCRMMANYKVVGIDMSFGPNLNAGPLTASLSGYVKYFAPTKGRVEACKQAYKSVRRMMKLSGVSPTHAITYDFRPLISDPASFENGSEIGNQASIEDNGLATCLVSGPPGSSNVFGIYNQGIIPRDTAGTFTSFEEGFDIGLRTNAAGADWTLNERVYLEALTDPTASESLEAIPFELTYSSADTTNQIATSDNMEWRPDPALYLSVLTGQLIIAVEDSAAIDENGDDAMNSTELEVAVHVAGWKGFLGSGKKRRHSKKGGKSHGRKRRHSKR